MKRKCFLRKICNLFFFSLLFLLISEVIFAQRITISGRITDNETGAPIPFVNVYFPATTTGTVSDFEGFYQITTLSPMDTLAASIMGYNTQKVPILPGQDQIINFIMSPSVISLPEVIFHAGENPAYPILRSVVQNKDNNDKRKLDYYENQSYNRIEISVNNVSEKLQQNRIMKDVIRKIDSVQVLRDERGKKIIPIFISESLSNYYVKNNPESRKEEILKTNISGIGIEDGEFISQLIGSSFQEYNFYRNWLKILEKEFVSPIADSWKIYYDYELMDSTFIDGYFCYQIGIFPKNEKDLAFSGTMWITRHEYAIKQIDVTVQNASNLNYIESIKIRQVLDKTSEGPWLPVKTRVILDMAQLSDQSAGLLASFYSSNKEWKINQSKPLKFYSPPVELMEDFLEKDPDFWDRNRHDTLTVKDKVIFSMVDTISNIPKIRTYASLVKMLSTGYLRLGKIDLGPVLYTYSYNNIEGNRIRFGLRTNEYLSKKITLQGYLAYGFQDRGYKFGALASYIFDRKHWVELSIGMRREIDQVGLPWDELTENYFFLTLTRFGTLRYPYKSDKYAIRLFTDFGKGFSQKITLSNDYFSPLYPFAFYNNQSSGVTDLRSDFKNTMITYELRYARDEKFLINGNQRISTGILRAPAFNIRYKYGLKNFLGGDFEYHQVEFEFEDKLNLGLLGVSHFKLSAGKTFNILPYPLLFIPIGNETIFYTTAAYNLMNYFEFVNDTYAALKYEHKFEGFMLNRIPLIRKLKLRLIGHANVIWGSLDPENISLIPEFDTEGNPIEPLYTLENKPYIELGYGIENILKVIRVDFFHRLTYLDHPGVNPFGVRISFQIIL